MRKPPADHLVKRSRASLIILITLAFLLMASIIVLICQLPEDEAWQLSAQTEETQEAEQVGFDTEPVEAQRLYPFGDGLYKVTAGRVARLDNQGHEIFASDTELTSPFVIQGHQRLLVADREGHQFIIFDEEKEIFRGQATGRISNADLSSQGHVLLVQDQTGSTGFVSLYEPDTGTHLFDVLFSESGYALSASFTPDGSHFDVSILNTQSATPFPIVKRYNLQGQTRGQRMPDLHDLYPLVFHTDENQVILCGASNLVALAYEDEHVLWQKSFYQIQAVIPALDKLYVLAAEEIDGPYMLFAIDSQGRADELHRVGEAPAAFALSDQLAAIASGSRLQIISLQDGQLLHEKQMPAEVVRLQFASDNAILVVARTGVRRIDIR